MPACGWPDAGVKRQAFQRATGRYSVHRIVGIFVLSQQIAFAQPSQSIVCNAPSLVHVQIANLDQSISSGFFQKKHHFIIPDIKGSSNLVVGSFGVFSNQSEHLGLCAFGIALLLFFAFFKFFYLLESRIKSCLKGWNLRVLLMFAEFRFQRLRLIAECKKQRSNFRYWLAIANRRLNGFDKCGKAHGSVWRLYSLPFPHLNSAKFPDKKNKEHGNHKKRNAFQKHF